MRSLNKYYLIAFIEGACVMAIELAGAKMIAPFYGTSLYVWASVLAVTLGGLALGYFLGGRATFRFPGPKLLFLVLLLGAILVALMPVFALHIMPATSGMDLRLASLISATGFMLLPLICMGMVSPIIIQLSNASMKTIGKTAGTVYAISTVGGIIMTLLMGFYLLPEWGIRKSVFLTAGLLAAMPVLLFVVVRKFLGLLMTGLFVMILILFASTKPFEDPELDMHYLYQSEGILGQVSVLEDPKPESNRVFRYLFINHIPQTKCNTQVIPASGWFYPHRIATLASIKPKGSRVLLIGMGGGNIAMELKKMGFKIDIVEIDRRMPKVAREFFGFEPEGINIKIDDGRHFLKTTREKYDLVITDVINGETQPYQLFTMEAFAELKKIITPDALVMINFQGYLHGKHGRAARSIYKTLLESGFTMQHFFAGSEEEDGDIHFLASLVKQDFRTTNETRLNACCKTMEFKHEEMVTDKEVLLNDALILTDDKPRLEVLNSYWNEQWRKKAIVTLNNLTDDNIPFFQ